MTKEEVGQWAEENFAIADEVSHWIIDLMREVTERETAKGPEGAQFHGVQVLAGQLLALVAWIDATPVAVRPKQLNELRRLCADTLSMIAVGAAQVSMRNAESPKSEGNNGTELN